MEKYYYINLNENKLLRVIDTMGEERYKFTEQEFERFCNLFGFIEEDYHKIGEQ